MRKTAKLFLFALMLAFAVSLLAISASAATLSSDGTDAETVFNNAIAAAQNEDVTITLTGTWTLSDNVTIGSADSIPTHTISVTGGAINVNDKNLILYGQFEFDNMQLLGSGKYANNAFVFPNGCSGKVGSGMAALTSTATGEGGRTAPNFVGQDVEVLSGSFHFIGGNINGTGISVANPHVVIGGTTDTIYAAAGTYNGGGLSGNGYIELNDNVTVRSRLMNGGWYYTANSFDRCEMVINGGNFPSSVVFTDGVSGGTINTEYVITVNGGTFNWVQALQQGSGGTLDLRNYHLTINGGTFTNFFAGVQQTAATSKKVAGGNITVDVNGGTFTNFYGGSRSTVVDTTSQLTTVININAPITVTKFYAGSNLGYASADGTTPATAKNNTTINFKFSTPGTFSGEFYLGSYSYALNTYDSGSYTLNANSNVTFAGPTSMGASVYKTTSASSILHDSATRTVNVTGSTFTGKYYGNALELKSTGSAAGSYTTGAIYWSGDSNITITDSTFNGGFVGGVALYNIAPGLTGTSTYTLTNCAIPSTNCFFAHDVRLGADTCVINDTVNATLNNCTIGVTYYGFYAEAWKFNIATTLNITLNDTESTVAGGYFGMTTGGSYCNRSGDTVITINRGIYNNNGTFYGGSYLANIDAIHSGKTTLNLNDTTIVQKSGDTSYASITAGSNLVREGATHTGEIVVNLTNSTVPKPVMAGCYFNTSADKPFPGEGHTGDRTVNIYSGTYNGVYGGSCVPVASEAPVIGGNSEINIYGGNFTSSVYGGPDVRPGVAYTGDYEINITGGTFDANVFAGPRTDSGTIVEGALPEWTGNSTLNFGGTATANRSLIAGGYGYGISRGDSRLVITGGTITGSGSYGCFGGDYGLNGKYPTVPTEYEGVVVYGIRRYGNVGIDISGGDLDTLFYGSGVRATVLGNVTHNISGGNINYLFYGGCYMTGENWQNSVIGNITTNISGGTFAKDYFGGNGATSSARESYKPSAGYNVITGDTVTNVTGGSLKGIYGAGTNGAGGDIVVKFSGDQFTFDGVVWANSAGSAYQPTRKGTQILDLSEVTLSTADYAAQFSRPNGYLQTNGSYTWFLGAFTAQGWLTVYPALSDIDTVTVTGYKDSYARGDALDLSDGSFALNFKTPIYYNHYDPSNGNYRVIQSITLTGEKLNEIAPDYLAGMTFKTASGTAMTDGKVGMFTTSAIPTDIYGKDYPAISFTNTSIALADAKAASDFTYLGVSMRASDSALRARAAITGELRGYTVADNGYAVFEYGTLLSKGATELLTLGGSKVSKAVAFKGTTDVYFLEDGKYTFAAALTDIPASGYDTAVKFRHYITLVDEYGEAYTAYADLSAVTNFKNAGTGNIEVTLRGLANYIKDNVVDFYTANKSKIDAIING